MDNTRKYKIFLNVVARENAIPGSNGQTGSTLNNSEIVYKIKRSDGVIGDMNDSDFFINIPIYQTQRSIDYVDTQVEDNVYEITRQEFNPYYIEYGFFDTTETILMSRGEYLDNENVDYIRQVRPSIDADFPPNENKLFNGVYYYGDEGIKAWYQAIGRLQFPWNETGVEVNEEDVALSSINQKTIYGKAQYFPIQINK
jgi:hypothetical protein